MIFSELNDIKNLMKTIITEIDQTNPLYKDFIWFSSVNYTTTTEYYGELKIFLSHILSEGNVPCHQEELTSLLATLEKTFQ